MAATGCEATELIRLSPEPEAPLATAMTQTLSDNSRTAESGGSVFLVPVEDAATCALPAFDFEQLLAEEQEKDLLRFLTCGSVDDGKSTLIGRLLYDSQNVFEDQIHAVAKASEHRSANGAIDLSLLTDGLRAEREQGITIDVAYRYFATARRKFIIADTPGHEQYTRNMATGASTCHLAILLIDARHGVLPQSRRHGFICSLLGIRNYVVAVNKMDLVGYDQAVFERIRDEFTAFLASVGVENAYFIPVSALAGDNVVRHSHKMPWFNGPNLLEHLETVEIDTEESDTGFRMAVQRVVRPDHTFRGYAGQIASGAIHPGDDITVLPSGLRSRVKRIATFDGDLKEASVSMPATIVLEDELDISRGDMLFSGPVSPHISRQFEAHVVWMNDRPLDPARRYLVKHTTQTAAAEITAIRYRIDIHTLAHEPAQELPMNAIGLVEITTAKPIFFDAYARNRFTGSFIIIDPATNATAGAGMLVQPKAVARRSGAVAALAVLGPVTPAERIARWGHRAAVVRLGHRAALAQALERKLFERGCAVVVLEHWHGETVKALDRAGILVLVLAPRPIEEEPLPGDDLEAADEIMRRLEEQGILRPMDAMTGGGGI
ncbi:MAG TPA: sulfate adenylyltransferase subunit CysN [Bryobacteraceae bacterium]|nr:sulfate adenylyltransferase subunit CysN [Bryobacteraceae bacterium]